MSRQRCPVRLRGPVVAGLFFISSVFLAPYSISESPPQGAPKFAASGWQAFQDGHPDEAKRLLTRAIDLTPHEPRYRVLLAEVAWSTGDTQSAIRQMNSAVKLDPRNYANRLRLAQRYQSLNKDLDALRILSIAEPDGSLLTAWRFSRGFSLFRVGRLPAAQGEFKSLVNHPETKAPASFFLGNIAYVQNRFEEADKYFAEAVRLGDLSTNKAFNAYTYDYGLALFSSGHYAEANLQFMRSAERFSQDPLPWMMHGRCEENMGHYPQAIEAYEKSIQINPQLWASYYQLARLQQQYGDKQRAAELFKKIATLKEAEIQETEKVAMKPKN